MTVESVLTWRPRWAIPPGEILAEALEERGMAQAELARRMGRPTKTINEIVRGKASITAETALQLEHVLETPARFWLNLERDYRESLARAKEQGQLAEHADWARRFPLGAMRNRDLVPLGRTKAELVEAVLRFFGVSSPEAWERQQEAMVAVFRQSTAFAANPEALAVWLRLGELRAGEIRTQVFDAAGLAALLPELRRLSRMDPSHFSRKLVEQLAAVGVALVFIREVPGTHVMAATRWVASDRVLIQMSLRYRRDDQFWFALFHEFGHALEGNRRRGYVEDSSIESDSEERAADAFATEWLVPTDRHAAFVARGDFTPGSVTEFADAIGIAAGIVVGRLQHEGQIRFSELNYLKQPIAWPDDPTLSVPR